MLEDFTEAWEKTREEVEARTQRLISELDSAWNEVQAFSQDLGERFRAFAIPGLKSGSVESLQILFGNLGGEFLLNPLASCQKKSPNQRALAAIRDYQSGLEDLIRQLPVTARTSGPAIAGTIGALAGLRCRAAWLRFRKAPKSMPLRAVVSGHLEGENRRRQELDGAFQLVLARSVLHLVEPWQICRRELLNGLAGKPHEGAGFESEREWWLKTAARLDAGAGGTLAAYRTWAERLTSRLARAVLRSNSLSERDRQRLVDRRQANFGYWSRQQRAVAAVIDLERELTVLEGESAQITEEALTLLEEEHQEVLSELDSVIEWVERWQRGAEAGSFPPPKARLLTAQDRVGDWTRNVSARVRLRLATTIESVQPSRNLPGWRSPWRQLSPQGIVLNAVERSARSIALEGFREAETGHKAIIREIERAREVVTFGLDTAQAEMGAADLAKEAVANAHSLLLYQKRTVADVRPMAEQSIVRAQSAALLESHIALEEGRLGQIAYLTRQSGRRTATLLLAISVEGLRAVSRRVSRVAQRAYRWVLQQTGWAARREAPRVPVTQRPFLGQVLELQVRARNLPMLYRRLFRLAPVEEPRFLVGRDAEMMGLAEALRRWQEGQDVSVIVVGARGSGKTSLLNCAAAKLLSGVPVVRGQFYRRVRTPEDLDAQLRELLELPDGANTGSALKKQKRVIIIEELERVFLRTMNGFGGLDSFLALLDETARTTLWILSINETSFRYLDFVSGLGRHFSHRVNAMQVKPEHLTSAIIQRHNLSGLRLQFAPLPEGDPRIGRVRRLFGLEADPQQSFFESLYDQSEGIFRAAFELWQDCIEREEGGVIHIRQPLRPDYRALGGELSQEDAFALQAILQHGSLTAAELGEVIGGDPGTARRRLERLLVLEVLEPDPVCPGLRVRPQAGCFVRESLHHRNLL